MIKNHESRSDPKIFFLKVVNLKILEANNRTKLSNKTIIIIQLWFFMAQSLPYMKNLNC